MFNWKRCGHYVTTQAGSLMLTMEKQFNKVVAAEDSLIPSDLHQGMGEVNLRTQCICADSIAVISTA